MSYFLLLIFLNYSQQIDSFLFLYYIQPYRKGIVDPLFESWSEVRNMDFKNLAMENIKALSQNPYPGRGIILGRTPDGDPVQIYWIMGRSESSRDRILQPVTGKGGWLRT